jgi:hypothetical protein
MRKCRFVIDQNSNNRIEKPRIGNALMIKERLTGHLFSYFYVGPKQIRPAS